jgi:hypothetical protein
MLRSSAHHPDSLIEAGRFLPEHPKPTTKALARRLGHGEHVCLFPSVPFQKFLGNTIGDVIRLPRAVAGAANARAGSGDDRAER